MTNRIHKDNPRMLVSLFHRFEHMDTYLKKGTSYLPKIRGLMPRFDWLYQHEYEYGERHWQNYFSHNIGNFFLLSGTNRELDEIPYLPALGRIHGFFEHSAGIDSAGVFLGEVEWGWLNIQERRKYIFELVVENLPESCWDDDWYNDD